MRKKWIKVTLAVGLILLPIVIWWHTRAFPGKITIAVGQESGLYKEIMEALARELKREGVDVTSVPTGGSVENLRRLRDGTAQLALYQAGTLDFLTETLFDRWDTNPDRKICGKEFHKIKDDSDFKELYEDWDFQRIDKDGDHFLQLDEFVELPGIRFVANTHYDVAHVVARPEFTTTEQLAGKRVSVGTRLSGDYAVSGLLLQSLGPNKSVAEEHWGYTQVEENLLSEPGGKATRLHAAIIVAGDKARVLQRLLRQGQTRLLEIPHARALAKQRVLVQHYTIEAGYYRSGPDPVPPRDISTIALRAELLTREDTSPALVEKVTRIVRRLAFVKKNQLTNLFDEGDVFARKNPEFPVHAGAERVYDPVLHPFLPTEFVESTEGIRSFVVSFIIAAFFGFRWLRERQRKRTEHRLDRYIRALLEIERRQIPLDRSARGDDLERLQELLDEVTLLRQEALREMSTHDLSEDRGGVCFIDMSHELSQKINAKLTRQSMERQFARLAEVVGGNRDRSGESESK